MNKVVDARGLLCPQPVIMAKQAIKEMAEGKLEVLVDNEIAVQNLMKLGNYSALSPVSEKLGDKEYKVTFQVQPGEVDPADDSPEKSGTSAAVSTAAIEADSCVPDARRKGTVVVLSSDKMGEGSDELGRILMKGFIYALTKLEDIPETILLYNHGARLSSEGSESLEDLKQLEALGVEIMTCGTCLDFNGLSGKLKVGNVTNMYEIAERLLGAAAIVRP